jgi:hypothetical protein
VIRFSICSAAAHRWMHLEKFRRDDGVAAANHPRAGGLEDELSLSPPAPLGAQDHGGAARTSAYLS